MSENHSLIIRKTEAGMTLPEFQKCFPGIPLTVGDQKDYDPALWADTIRHCKFVTREETLQGMTFLVFCTFQHEVLSFLQYYGRTAPNEVGFEAAKKAFTVLAEEMQRILGAPGANQAFISYASFRDAPRSTSGHPDDRYVEVAGMSWQGAYLTCCEDSAGSLSVELRMGA